MLIRAIDSRVTFIDTANIYSNQQSEKIISRALVSVGIKDLNSD